MQDHAYWRKLGWAAVRQIGEHEWIGVMAMTFGKGRLCSGLNEQGYEDCWCFETLQQALDAMVQWDPETQPEPLGWFRHPYSGRRREAGDPAREVVFR